MTAHASSFSTCAALKSPFQLSFLGVISGVFRLCKRQNFASGNNLPGRTTVRYCHVSGCAISWSTSPFNCHKKPLICTLQQRRFHFFTLRKIYLLLIHCSKELQKRKPHLKFSFHYITRTRKRRKCHLLQKILVLQKTPFTYCLFFKVFTPSFEESFLSL